MIYQVMTYNDLCNSKVILSKREEILKHLDRVVNVTEVYRKSLEKNVFNLTGWNKTVTKKEMEHSMCINKIEERDVPRWKKIFRSNDEICAKNLKNFVDYVIRKSKETTTNEEE